MVNLHDMNFLDWVILALVAISVIGSLLKGFARETISLGSVLLGLVLASWCYPVVAVFFDRYVRTKDIAAMLGFVMIFAGCLLLGAVISFFVYKFLRIAHLQWFDRLLGAAFGLVRGWMIAAILILLLTAFPVEITSVEEAQLAPYLLVSARALIIITPHSLRERFLEGYKKVERLWREQQDQSSKEHTTAICRLKKHIERKPADYHQRIQWDRTVNSIAWCPAAL